MTDNIYHYVTRLPDGFEESVMPCADGYTIYTDDRLSPFGRIRAYNHAMEHIKRDDWGKESVQFIESQ